MKKLVTAVILFSVVGLSSCKKDEAAVPVQKEAKSAAKCRQCGNGSWD